MGNIQVNNTLHQAQVTLQNTDTSCSHLVGLASYKRFQDSNINHQIDNQELYDWIEYILAPGETRTLTVTLPSCTYQVDAFCGPHIDSFYGGIRYGDRLIDDYVGGSPYCQPLVGHVNWQGRPNQPHSLQSLPVTLTLKLGTTEKNFRPRSTDASGFFTVSVDGLANGSYNWRVKGPKYLSNRGTVALSGSSAINVEMSQARAGDANNDNLVGVVDFNMLRPTFGRSSNDPAYDDRADFTGDRQVNVGDFTLLKTNFGGGGGSPLQPEG